MQAGTFEYGSGAIPATTLAAVGIVGNCQRYNRMAFSITGLAAETVSIAVSFDYDIGNGTGTFETPKVRPIDLSTGALAAASDLGNGTYLLVNTPWRAIQFTKSAAVNTVTVRYGLLNAN